MEYLNEYERAIQDFVDSNETDRMLDIYTFSTIRDYSGLVKASVMLGYRGQIQVIKRGRLHYLVKKVGRYERNLEGREER